MTSLYHVPGGGYYDRPISSMTNALGQRVDNVGGTLRDANGNDLLAPRTPSMPMMGREYMSKQAQGEAQFRDGRIEERRAVDYAQGRPDDIAMKAFDVWRRGGPIGSYQRAMMRDYLMRHGFGGPDVDFNTMMSNYVSSLNSAAQKSAYTSTTTKGQPVSQPVQPYQSPQPEQPQTIHVGGEKPKKPTDPSAWVRYKPVRTRKVAKVPTIDDTMPGVKTLI